MELFNVYPRFDVTPVKAKGAIVTDDKGIEYLDLYGGHGVISIGHQHPKWVKAISQQLNDISFYSNSVQMPIQGLLAEKLGKASGYPDYQLFLCNSGAEANENALKLASFHNEKKKVIAFKNSFHGRTAATLNVTDHPNLSASINQENFEVAFATLNDKASFLTIADNNVSAVIIEGIQGVGGLDLPSIEFLKFLKGWCENNDALLILDEIQSGFGRSGDFFAHQGVTADIITMAKGMGNGFPVAGILINPTIKAKPGMLGTTFGGNYLACAATLAVLEVIENEKLLNNAKELGENLTKELTSIPAVQQVKGKGLMLGVEFDFPIKALRQKLLFESKIFTGASNNPNLLRILPPLSITVEQLNHFVNELKKQLI